MIEYKVSKDSKLQQLIVNVKAPAKSRRPWLAGLRQVSLYLRENNIPHGKCLTPKEYVCTATGRPEATYVFELASKTKDKENKELDKPPQIVVELKDAKRTTKTRARRNPKPKDR